MMIQQKEMNILKSIKLSKVMIYFSYIDIISGNLLSIKLISKILKD